MEVQKHEARASWKGSGDDGIQKIWFDLAKKFKPTIFEGYTKSSISSEIISINISLKLISIKSLQIFGHSIKQ